MQGLFDGEGEIVEIDVYITTKILGIATLLSLKSINLQYFNCKYSHTNPY